MASTIDTRPREVRKQAQQHADAARNRMDARRREQDDGLTGWLNKRAGDWELSGPDEATMQRQKYVWNFLVDYWFRMEFDPAAPDSMATALAEGRDVAVWPGGEVDSLRPWSERDRANLAGRRGFVKMAIRAGVPIVPIATVGGADAMPVLVRGDQLSRALRLDKLLRLKVFPIAVSLPWGIAPAALPQLPLPAKIRTQLMPAVELDHDPDRADDDEYLEEKYCEVQNSIQQGMDALARKRALPLFG